MYIVSAVPSKLDIKKGRDDVRIISVWQCFFFSDYYSIVNSQPKPYVQRFYEIYMGYLYMGCVHEKQCCPFVILTEER